MVIGWIWDSVCMHSDSDDVWELWEVILILLHCCDLNVTGITEGSFFFIFNHLIWNLRVQPARLYTLSVDVLSHQSHTFRTSRFCNTKPVNHQATLKAVGECVPVRACACIVCMSFLACVFVCACSCTASIASCVHASGCRWIACLNACVWGCCPPACLNVCLYVWCVCVRVQVCAHVHACVHVCVCLHVPVCLGCLPACLCACVHACDI